MQYKKQRARVQTTIFYGNYNARELFILPLRTVETKSLVTPHCISLLLHIFMHKILYKGKMLIGCIDFCSDCTTGIITMNKLLPVQYISHHDINI